MNPIYRFPNNFSLDKKANHLWSKRWVVEKERAVGGEFWSQGGYAVCLFGGAPVTSKIEIMHDLETLNDGTKSRVWQYDR